MLDPVKEPIQEHVILLGVSELIIILYLEALHELAELILGQEVLPVGVPLHDPLQRLEESLLSLLIVDSYNWPFQKIDYKLGSILNRNHVVSLKVEQ